MPASVAMPWRSSSVRRMVAPVDFFMDARVVVDATSCAGSERGQQKAPSGLAPEGAESVLRSGPSRRVGNDDDYDRKGEVRESVRCAGGNHDGCRPEKTRGGASVKVADTVNGGIEDIVTKIALGGECCAVACRTG
jgi:hypothetical protein